jgi:acyl dehydratase
MALPTTRWFDDIKEGQVAEFGDYLMTQEEIIEFAGKYDPQPFHTDPEAAKSSVFGGLIASGWHTAAAMMRMLVDNSVSKESALGSPGIDELRWLKPVRPGDRLRLRVTVVKAVPSRSKPDRGTVHNLTEVFNQAGEVVMTVKGMGMFRRRPTAE